MPTVNNLSIQQLENQQVFEKVRNLVFELIEFSQTTRSLAFVTQLKIALQKLQTSQSSKTKTYQELLYLLMWSAFSNIQEEDCLFLLKKQLLIAIKNNLPLEDLIESRLFVYPFVARQEAVKQFRGALEQNAETIGGSKISEWIGLYNQHEDFTKRNNLSLLNFFNQSQKAQSLSQQERDSLQQILDTYDDVLLEAPVADKETTQQLAKTLSTRIGEPIQSQKPKEQTIVAEVPKMKEPEKKIRSNTNRQSETPRQQTDKYREPIAQEDLANKYKNTAQQAIPDQPGLKNKDDVIVNPLNIVDLRRDQK